MDLSLLAQAQLRDFLSSFALDGDPVRVRDALLQFFPELVTTYGDVSALLASDFYDSLRDVPPSAASFRAVFADPVSADAAAGSVRWAVGALFGGDESLFMLNLLGATQRLVSQRGRDTMVYNSGRDPVRTAFARIPSGADTCTFCLMTASRGAVYRDEVSAGEMNDYHDNCDCAVIPVRRKTDFPEGHDLAALTEAYRSGVGTGRYAGVTSS